MHDFRISSALECIKYDVVQGNVSSVFVTMCDHRVRGERNVMPHTGNMKIGQRKRARVQNIYLTNLAISKWLLLSCVSMCLCVIDSH